MFLLATCNTLAVMSIDRCFYIILPRTKLQWRTSKNALITCILVWTGKEKIETNFFLKNFVFFKGHLL